MGRRTGAPVSRVQDVQLTDALIDRLGSAFTRIRIGAGEPTAIVMAPLQRLVNRGEVVETFWGVPIRTHDDVERDRILVRTRSFLIEDVRV